VSYSRSDRGSILPGWARSANRPERALG